MNSKINLRSGNKRKNFEFQKKNNLNSFNTTKHSLNQKLNFILNFYIQQLVTQSV